MPEFEYTPDTQTLPTEEMTEITAAQRTKIIVVVFKELSRDDATIITQTGGRLFTGDRTIIDPRIKYDSCPSPERDAIEIAKKHQITATAHAHLPLDDKSITDTQAYSVERASHTALPNTADFTNHTTPTSHSLPLEVHRLRNLIKLLENQPEYAVDVACLRAFDKFAFSRSR